ncbi:MAG: tRNA (adenosine(37)-N6)-dimethylallyltransferase MiaA [Rhodospirillales bacterium]|nr:tRNA (adenosine(37)-N6)-dimethylallyltransferase MiaA [Rhodospirillales bacterium]
MASLAAPAAAPAAAAGRKDPPAVIVAGPTASGKSALALALARRLDGTVINADAMQVYRDLRVLTARPSAADEALVPHALYGVRPAAEPGSAAWWRAAALEAMEAARAGGRVPILCGGSGLYLAALVEGLADIPDPGPAARAEARGLLASLGPAALHARLAAVDPVTAARLRPSDSQRIARAYEVWRGTGRGLAAWQDAAPERTAPGWRFAAITLDPPREALRAAAAARFDAMLEDGAIEEVRALLRLGLDPALPLMRAHGVPELAGFLRGELSLADAARRAVAATGRYMKRQSTWLRHHALAPAGRAHMIHARSAGLAQFSERILAEIIEFIHSPG